MTYDCNQNKATISIPLKSAYFELAKRPLY